MSNYKPVADGQFSIVVFVQSREQLLALLGGQAFSTTSQLSKHTDKLLFWELPISISIKALERSFQLICSICIEVQCLAVGKYKTEKRLGWLPTCTFCKQLFEKGLSEDSATLPAERAATWNTFPLANSHRASCQNPLRAWRPWLYQRHPPVCHHQSWSTVHDLLFEIRKSESHSSSYSSVLGLTRTTKIAGPSQNRNRSPLGHWIESLPSSRRMTSPMSPFAMSSSSWLQSTKFPAPIGHQNTTRFNHKHRAVLCLVQPSSPGWIRQRLRSLGLNFHRPFENWTRNFLCETLIPTTCPSSPFFTSSSWSCHFTRAPNCSSSGIKESTLKLQVSLAKATLTLPASLMSPGKRGPSCVWVLHNRIRKPMVVQNLANPIK